MSRELDLHKNHSNATEKALWVKAKAQSDSGLRTYVDVEVLIRPRAGVSASVNRHLDAVPFHLHTPHAHTPQWTDVGA